MTEPKPPVPYEPEPKTYGQKHLDIGLGWLLVYEHTSHWMDFKAYQVVSSEVYDAKSGARLPTLYSKADCLPTDNLDEAEPEFTGYVKWDGCCELDLDYNHFCGRQNMEELTQVLLELHKLCLLLPNVDPGCAGYA